MWDKDTIIKAVGGSLMAFLFYGHIDTAATQKTIITKQEQSDSELDDLWGKYNEGQAMFVEHLMKEMDYKVKQAEKWEQYWKEKYEANK